METNINSRQTRDEIRGAPGYRPTLNSYLWADARAIALVADLAGDEPTARAYRDKAAQLVWPQLFADFTPATSTGWRRVERLITDDGMHFFDYLKGDDEYKKRWAPLRRQRLSLLCHQRGTLGACLRFFDESFLPRLRRNRLLTAVKCRVAGWLPRAPSTGLGHDS